MDLRPAIPPAVPPGGGRVVLARDLLDFEPDCARPKSTAVVVAPPAAVDGATPLDIARTKGNQQAGQLLTSMGGVCRTAC